MTPPTPGGTKPTEAARTVAAPAAFAGRVIREREPENFEFPFSALQSFTTPTEQFFIRSHFAVPRLDRETWRLRIEGQVHRPCELSYSDLLQFPQRSVVATLECAGNSRIFLNPKVGGLQWELGAVSNAEWSGVSLASVLERAGVRAGAVEVVLEGADSGEIKKEPVSPGKIQFAHSLPLSKALDPDVLLATHMNGEELPPSHGFPVRAIVPGWYGVASVKWVTRLVVTDQLFRGYFQSSDYTFWEQRENLPIQLLPITEMEVKAEVARPALREVVPADAVYRVHGAAWTGEAQVARVEVSTDGGKNWEKAELLGRPVRYAWRLWEFHWRTPAQPGFSTIMARATDDRGQVQPMQRDSRRGNYAISHVQPIEVEIRRMNTGGTDSYAI